MYMNYGDFVIFKWVKATRKNSEYHISPKSKNLNDNISLFIGFHCARSLHFMFQIPPIYVIMRAKMQEEPKSPLNQAIREKMEPTININEESDLEEETTVVKLVEENALKLKHFNPDFIK
ncbi:hypothetical protein CWI38_0156p0030 [Hamiltosporidium tvaerminnensis]|uniref:Uncharacterized protein n=1 Tax=Hamiltosporidium tvaerminnensis TaxID=1176355 RepID=A0A4Q9M083_9MICR|nr:hypothetical protein CWI38_0156p0030 [Hamiltosporidium tvaerminnensis]